MSKDLDERLNNRKVKPVGRLAYFGMYKLSKFSARKIPCKVTYNFDVKKYKNKQIILIADHSSRDVFGKILPACKFTRINYVAGYHNFFDGNTFRLFSATRVIPKALYQPDLRATKDMMKIVKQGGSLGIFVEGIQSTSGSTHPINPATIKLLKKCGLPIIMASSFGAYLNLPRFTTVHRYGPMELHIKEIITKEDIQNISEEDLYNLILKEFKYNDFNWNKEHHYSYIGDEANCKGLTGILYRCPKCGYEFRLMEKGDYIECHHCKNAFRVDEHYDLIPINDSYIPYKTIDEWYKDQRKYVREQIAKEPINIKFEVTLRDIYKDRIRKHPYYDAGHGEMVLTNEGLSYKGTYKGENVEFFFDIKGLPSAPLSPNEGFDFYYDNKYYSVIIKDHPEISCKIMMLIEELHNLQDSAWNKASRDAYED